MKKRHVIGIAIIGMVIILSAVSFKTSLTPYVTFAQAQKMSSSVQVRGALATKPMIMMDGGQGVKFKLVDEKGQEEIVIYKGARPDGLEQVTSIVAIGKYQSNQFVAEKLLIKCPSKYQSIQGSGENR